ncbi:ATP-grasp domain-containing protein [Pedococcus sp. P5_B7]
MAKTQEHLIGLLLGAEGDWPRAFETLAGRLGVLTGPDGASHQVNTERVTIEPFNLRDKPRHDLVIDRLAYWYYHPREWLKKVALMDDVYLLNSPFTFQSMEKHSAYCALLRLGMHVPETVLVPYKNPLDNVRWAYTAERYNKSFDLDQIAEEIGYPLFMKPFDGGGWRGVSQVKNVDDLHSAYDDSGEMLMHLQASVKDFEVFARALTIGPETMVMKFQPDEPMHNRYAVEHGFLSEGVGTEAVTIAQTVNAFFRWEFNSCEMLVKDGVVYPIDYANACPDVAVTSLHYYFPWAMKALIKWSVFCVATGRKARTQVDTDPWFSVADDADLDYGGKLSAYQGLADAHFDTDRYREFCDAALPHIDEMVLEWVDSDDFRSLLSDTIQTTYPKHEWDKFEGHFGGLTRMWVKDEQSRLGAGSSAVDETVVSGPAPAVTTD